MNEAELLFMEILNCQRMSLYLNKDLPLNKDKSSLVASVLKRRIYGEPLQYILGKTEFMGLEFKVGKGVFIPRPETEILVETVIKIVVSNKSSVISPKILDLGTGSGNIAVSLTKLLPNTEITATDISSRALKIARENAELYKVKINFVKSNLFDTYGLKLNTYNLIVSNPPYIPTAEIDNLQPEINYEPRIALDGGKDGLDFYRKIVNKAAAYLKEDGYLILEMGFKQREAIENIFRNSQTFCIKDIIKDYNHIDRVIVAHNRGRNG